eukprot:TRINITY_DN8590_c0_g1_i4.p1 TRINITY_DN8590_c0_g1~~TRINITY_DN8590_c0_g1_i4.p1  ORF type:complete len:595 (-),score=160.49 TRINITY_DN8590_c0_g1_i4:134-1918(-)
MANHLVTKLTNSNETVWLRLGALAESMHDADKAMYSYENALRHNHYNVKALTQVASICRMREQYPKAVEYFQRVLALDNTSGEIWGALGHCYLMMEDLQKAYQAYQQALYHLPNPKDPNLWYGIGILYDRYGSFEHAEEAFTAVLKMDSKFEKANEIYFRLGIIYKQQLKHEQSLECFRFILGRPPRPLVQADIWFQIGHVYELMKDFHAAKDAYERVLKENANHAKVLQQLGWLYHHNTNLANQEVAINYLMKSIDADPTDGQTWYLLGRCYMAQQKYRKAYDAYQQAVYRDGRNPTFWCSIGVLYYQINQYRDALDAYSRAIRLNPYLSEVWYDLGTLYESCNQINDSMDAYQRAAELDPNNKHIQQRLSLLRNQIATGAKPNGAGGVRDSSEPREKGTVMEVGEERENERNDRSVPLLLEPRAGGSAPSHSLGPVPLGSGMSSERARSSMGNGPSSHPSHSTSMPDLPDLKEGRDNKAGTLPSIPRQNRDREDGPPSERLKDLGDYADNANGTHRDIDEDSRSLDGENGKEKELPPMRRHARSAFSNLDKDDENGRDLEMDENSPPQSQNSPRSPSNSTTSPTLSNHARRP